MRHRIACGDKVVLDQKLGLVRIEVEEDSIMGKTEGFTDPAGEFIRFVVDELVGGKRHYDGIQIPQTWHDRAGIQTNPSDTHRQSSLRRNILRIAALRRRTRSRVHREPTQSMPPPASVRTERNDRCRLVDGLQSSYASIA